MEQPYFLDEEESPDGEKLDLGRYIRALKKRWWWVLIVTTVVTVPWVYYLKLQPPIYEATALIRFKSFTGSDMDLTRSRYTELTSRTFAEKVVSQLGLSLRMQKQGELRLSRSWIFQDFFTNRNPVPGEYVLKISAAGKYNLSVAIPDQNKEEVLESGFVEDITEGFCVTNGITFKLVSDGLEFPMEIPFSILSFRSAVQSFQSRIAVKWQDRMGTLMNLTMTDTDPRLVASMTNRLAQIFIEESASLKNESAKSRYKIIEEQTSLAEQELNEKERKLKLFKQKHNVFLDPSQKNQINELANMDRRKEAIQSTIQALRDLLSQKGASLSSNGKGIDPYYTDLRLVMNTIAQHSVFEDHSTMLLTRQKLKGLEANWARYAPENPRAKDILQEIRQMHSQVESIAQDQILKLEGDFLEVNRDLSRLESKRRQMPAREVELRELTRRFEVAQKAYTELLAKRQDAQISASVETEDIQILDKALAPKFPTNRDKQQNAAFGGIFGLLLGVGCVLVVEFLNKTIKSVDDVRKYLKLPVLGTIPQIDFNDVFDFQDSEKIKQIDQQLVTHDYSPTPIGEAYRSLRTNLMFTKDHGRISSLVITSNEPGDGKSFTAANLSITLAQLKSRTLLIDSDLRRGVLHNTFAVPKEPGFSNYLTDVVPLQTIIHETQIPNLSMISCGSLIPNPSELLGSHQMQRFLDEVRRKFDIIVFDSPPLNAATDAVVVGNQTDATVVVIRAGKTNRDLAKNKLNLFTNLPAKVLGAILNGTTADMAHPGYSYYHY